MKEGREESAAKREADKNEQIKNKRKDGGVGRGRMKERQR